MSCLLHNRKYYTYIHICTHTRFIDRQNDGWIYLQLPEKVNIIWSPFRFVCLFVCFWLFISSEIHYNVHFKTFILHNYFKTSQKYKFLLVYRDNDVLNLSHITQSYRTLAEKRVLNCTVACHWGRTLTRTTFVSVTQKYVCSGPLKLYPKRLLWCNSVLLNHFNSIPFPQLQVKDIRYEPFHAKQLQLWSVKLSIRCKSPPGHSRPLL